MWKCKRWAYLERNGYKKVYLLHIQWAEERSRLSTPKEAKRMRSDKLSPYKRESVEF